MFFRTGLGSAMASAVLLTTTINVQAADHLEAPLVMGRGQLDVNDLYAFQSPVNPDNSVLILTVNPGAGAISPTDFGTTSDGIAYDFTIDNNGDAVADLTYRASFSGSGQQSYTVTRFAGSPTGMTPAPGVLVGTGLTGGQEVFGNVSVQAGVFDDPFFFDLNGFNNGFQFTGEDFFAGLNVGAIVMELPSSDLTAAGDPNIAVLGRTVFMGTIDGETFNNEQFDRVGRPGIQTVLLPDDLNDEYNQSDPADDLANFGDVVNDNIAALSDQANADALTPVLLPDLLTFDTSSAAGFLNGRRLTDDVIDAELDLLTAGALATDMVDGNDVPFLDMFPYLAPANVTAIPEPGSATGLLALGCVAAARRRRRR